ncbi:mitochondrial carrier protein LEU5 [Thozetella sp. PMI_491]|nr:mitochondrial carrier protein LEU5 [Thozetella sp. PMI_491]
MSSAVAGHASMSEGPPHEPREAAGLASNGAPHATRRKRDLTLRATDETAGGPRRKISDRRSFDYLWRSGVAGGLAGCAAKTTVAPLDRVKILFQSHNPQFAKYAGSWAGVATAIQDIYRQDGPSGLFRGHSATLLRIFPYAAIKFLAYEQIRSVIIPSRDHETPIRRLLSGSLAGVTSVFFTYPLEVIRVRLAFETKRDSRSSLRSICKQIYHEHPYGNGTPSVTLPNAPAALQTAAGAAAQALNTVAPRSGIINFYRGFSPTMLGMVPYAGMSFLTHDTAGDVLRNQRWAKYTTLAQPENAPPGKPAPLRSWAELTAGGIAGLVSQTASYPLEVIRRRMQVGGAVGDGHRLRIGETAALIMKERGPSGFFVGLTIGYVKVFPLAAVSFYTYERMKTWLGI